jgi:site-specific DNA recombinase
MNSKQQPIKRTRCAVYTRKSTEEGLEQEFNSLDAQREAGEAYVASQRHEGWTLVPDYYDDGGFSGGSMERPALKRLLADIAAGKIDVIVVYKVDRLSRSLADFAKMVEIFDAHTVSFVSVTQQFNTTTSMGRLTLNILLSFAQFEREVIGERVRDKVAASKRKGMWMGGSPPYGYDVIERRLVINDAEAAVVRKIFQRFLVLRSTTKLTEELRQEGCLTKSYVTGSGRHKQGRLMDKGFLYKLLSNPVYLGETRHRDQVYPGQHIAIIDRAQWLEVRRIMEENPTARGNAARAQNPALLRGLIRCGGCDSGMTPTHTRRHGRQYRYYTPNAKIKKSCNTCPVGNVPAGEVEDIVMAQVKAVLATPEMIIKTWRAAQREDANITETEAAEALRSLHPLWNELFPAEQARILHLLVEGVVVSPTGVDVRLRTDGLTTLTAELTAVTSREAA